MKLLYRHSLVNISSCCSSWPLKVSKMVFSWFFCCWIIAISSFWIGRTHLRRPSRRLVIIAGFVIVIVAVSEFIIKTVFITVLIVAELIKLHFITVALATAILSSSSFIISDVIIIIIIVVDDIKFVVGKEVRILGISVGFVYHMQRLRYFEFAIASLCKWRRAPVAHKAYNLWSTWTGFRASSAPIKIPLRLFCNNHLYNISRRRIWRPRPTRWTEILVNIVS